MRIERKLKKKREEFLTGEELIGECLY